MNYLSGYLLTQMQLPLLVESAPSRVINIASGARTPIDFDDSMLNRGYSSARGYAQSKLAQILFTHDLAEELGDQGIIAVTIHPATLMATNLVLEIGARPMSTIAEKAEAVMNLITASGIENGQYYDGHRPSRADPQADDDAARTRLRRLSQELTGVVD